MREVDEPITEVNHTVVNSSEIGECMAPARFLGHCHERCTKVKTCKLPEGIRGALILAKRRLDEMQYDVNAQIEKVKRLEEAMHG